MKKTVTLLVSFIALSLVSCSDDDNNPMGNITPSARIDQIVFTEIPIFTSTKPSDYNYFSIVPNFTLVGSSNETISLKNESIYNESTGLLQDLVFTFTNEVLEPNSSFTLQTSILFGDSDTNYVSDLDNIKSLNLTEIYQYDNAATFQQSYSVEINATNTLLDNSQGSYSFTVYGTFIYE
ncbi:MAG: hypothetical protein AAF611_17250 [Bacteroidota bacterium]